MIGRRKGYRVALVMPDNVTNERRQMAALFGAEVIDSPGRSGSNGAIALAKHLVSKDERFVMPYQYGNPANPLAHYETTGPEILADCPEIDVFVAGLGTSGTLMGVSRYLHEHKPGVRIVAAEPLPGEQVQGLRSLDEGFIPEILDPSLHRREVPRLQPRRDRRAARPRVPRGHLRRAVVRGRARRRRPRGARRWTRGTIVALLPDGGWKYLSAGTFSTRPRRDGGGARGRRQLVVSEVHPGPRLGRPARRDPRRARRARPGRVPERGVRADRRRRGPRQPAAGRCASRRRATRPPRRFATRSTPTTCYRLTIETDDADEVFWAIVHSHTHSPAVPSPTDVGLAFYPDALYVLVSLSDDQADPVTGEPGVRAWRIVDGEVFEVGLS